jgi:membrane-associated phospholipid phosphatase
MMRNIFRENKEFFIPYLIFLLLLLPVLLLVPKAGIHLWINAQHSISGDILFRYLTWFGDGIMPFILGLIYCIFSFKRGLVIILSGTLAGIIAQFFKRIVFPEVSRPVRYFEGICELRLVEGVEIHHAFSFPSGHAATAFAIFLSLSVFVKHKLLKSALFFMAFLVAFSRVYLSQHFINDIYAGSIIGVLSGVTIIWLISAAKAKWLNKSFKQLVVKR